MWDTIINLFKEFTPLGEIYKDPWTIIMHINGGIFISSSFMAWGLIFIFSKKTYIEKTNIKEHKNLPILIGWALILCGIARFVDVIAIWHNYGNLNAYIKNITGIVAYIGLFYLPFILRIIKKQTTINEIKDEMVKTQEKMEELITIEKEIKKK